MVITKNAAIDKVNKVNNNKDLDMQALYPVRSEERRVGKEG